MNFKNGVKKIQAVAYNGARTVLAIYPFHSPRNSKVIGTIIQLCMNINLKHQFGSNGKLINKQISAIDR